MQERPFGPTGRDVSVIGQGTWAFERGDRRAVIAAVHRGLDLGMTHIDTAEMYGQGKVEEVLAEALAGRRDEVFLVSKVLPENASRRGTVEACERSLRHLGTDYLDVYLLHWPSRHPLAGTIAAFQELQEAGKIRAWGVSNFDEDQLAEAITIAGPGKVACNQVLYHLEERRIEHAVIPFCEENGIPVVAYSPLGSGSFPSPKSPGGKVLSDIAGVHGATPHQVALAFLTRHPALFAVPKAARVAHAEDNAKAGDLALPAEEISRIDRVFPMGRRAKGVPTA